MEGGSPKEMDAGPLTSISKRSHACGVLFVAVRNNVCNIGRPGSPGVLVTATSIVTSSVWSHSTNGICQNTPGSPRLTIPRVSGEPPVISGGGTGDKIAP